MFIVLIILHFGFSTKVTRAFLLQENLQELSEINTMHASQKNDNIFHIDDQMKVSREPWGIGIWHVCMEGHCTLNSPINDENKIKTLTKKNIILFKV